MVRLLLLALILPVRAFAAAEEADEPEDVTVMAPLIVGATPIEEFGFRVRLGLSINLLRPLDMVRSSVEVGWVYPNTAASRAGLRPGDKILKTDGQSAAFSLFSITKWRKLQQKKATEAATGKSPSWTLEVQTPGSTTTRTVKLTLPTPPPRWGAMQWQAPVDREPAIVSEPGPLAALAQSVLDNGVWTLQPRGGGETPPPTGYDWNLGTRDGAGHKIFVTRFRGRTEIILEHTLRGKYRYTFYTSPSGELQRALGPKGGGAEPPLEEARAEFGKELHFWLNDVGRVTGRWPFEVSNPALAVDKTAGAAPNAAPISANLAKPPDSFLKLPKATAAQKELLTDAFDKLGADEDRWAYTETSTGLEDKHVMVARFDPSKTGNDRATLLKVDGKPPTPAAIQKWRDEGRDAPATLSELPPIRTLVDLDDVRVFSEDITSVVFELPLRSGNKDFPADKFQALFRVNKTHHGFEDFSVKLRGSFNVVGVVKVTEAGMEARFRSLDPALSPQPVLLKAGGAVRLLLVKFGRSFEASRQDFQRVEPAP